MKNPHNYHLDRSVLLSFLMASLLASFVLIFKACSEEPCPALVDFTVNGSSEAKHQFFSDQTIEFKFSGEEATIKNRIWEMGDGIQLDNLNPLHRYKETGEYTVSLTVNGQCYSSEKTITIEERPPDFDTTKIAKFNLLKESIEVGETVQLSDKTPHSEKTKWKLDDEFYSSSKDTTISFNASGEYKLTLIVNDENQYKTEKSIKVIEKEKQPAPTPGPVSMLGIAINYLGSNTGTINDATAGMQADIPLQICNTGNAKLGAIQISKNVDTPFDKNQLPFSLEPGACSETIAATLNISQEDIGRGELKVRVQTIANSADRRSVESEATFISINLAPPVVAPPPTPPPPEKCRDYSKESLEVLFKNYNRNNNSLQEILRGCPPCKKDNIEFYVKNEKRILSDNYKKMKFHEFWNQIEGRKIKEIAVTLNKDQNKCIHKMYIKYKLRGL